jgi:hypothetical protein
VRNASSMRDEAVGADAGWGKSSAALAGTVMLLGIGYVLLVAGPMVLQRLPWEGASAASWFPVAAGGLAVGGAAALVFVLGRLVRDVEHQPYACLAPVLAVFSAFVLAGLRVHLPLPGVAGEHFGVLAMAVAVAGGALVQQRGAVSGLVGLVLTLLPAGTLFGILAASSGKSDLRAIVGGLDPQVRVFAVLLAVSSLSMLAIAAMARMLRAHAFAKAATRVERAPVSVAQNDDEAALWERLRYEADVHTGPALLMRARMSPDSEIQRLTWTDEFPLPAMEKRGTPRWLAAILFLAAAGAVSAFGFRVYVWHQHQEAQAALEVSAAREREAQAREQEKVREAARRVEAADAEARLQALLTAKPAETAPAATPPPEPAAPEPAVAAAALVPVVAEAPAEEEPAMNEREKRHAEAAAAHEARVQARADKAARIEQERAERAEKAAQIEQEHAEREARAQQKERERAERAARAERERAERVARAERAEQVRIARVQRLEEARQARIEREEKAEQARKIHQIQKLERAKAEQQRANDKAVGKMNSSSNDPLFGLLK